MKDWCCLDEYMEIYYSSKDVLEYIDIHYLIKENSDKCYELNEAHKLLEQLNSLFMYELLMRERKILYEKYKDVVPLLNKTVAINLKISEATIQRHIRKIRIKFDENEKVFNRLKELINFIKTAYDINYIDLSKSDRNKVV